MQKIRENVSFADFLLRIYYGFFSGLFDFHFQNSRMEKSRFSDTHIISLYKKGRRYQSGIFAYSFTV